MEKPVLFFAFANRSGSPGRDLPNLPKELADIRDALKPLSARGEVEDLYRPFATHEDLLEVLQDQRYRGRLALFHFAGHAGAEEIMLETRDGGSAPAYGSGLAKLLGRRRIELAFLNGCSTRAQVDRLLEEGVRAVVATDRAIADGAAAELAKAFYDGLAEGAAVSDAFADATAALEMRFGDDPLGAYDRSFLLQLDSSAGLPWRLYPAEGSDWCLPGGSALAADDVDAPPAGSAGLAAPAPASPPLDTFGAALYQADLKIDRTRQWSPIDELCRTDEDVAFLLHGPKQQNIDLFIARVLTYLVQECPSHHRFYEIPLRVEFAEPRSIPAWENHLRFGLASDGAAGTAVTLLREAARENPIFLAFGKVPLAPGLLGEVEMEALLGFLRTRLPRLVAEASAGSQPIRLLIPTHYEAEDESLVDALDDALSVGCEAAGFQYRKLARLEPLEWIDVEDYLNSLHPRPKPTTYRALREAWEKLERESMQYREIVEFLTSKLY